MISAAPSILQLGTWLRPIGMVPLSLNSSTYMAPLFLENSILHLHLPLEFPGSHQPLSPSLVSAAAQWVSWAAWGRGSRMKPRRRRRSLEQEARLSPRGL